MVQGELFKDPHRHVVWDMGDEDETVLWSPLHIKHLRTAAEPTSWYVEDDTACVVYPSIQPELFSSREEAQAWVIYLGLEHLFGQAYGGK